MSDWDSNEPWFEIDGFAEILLDKISILDILDRYEVEYTATYAGAFSHKAHCPFPAHLQGNERTASLFVSEEDNSFHCFGCKGHGTAINFVMLYKGMPYYRVLEELSNIAGITDGDFSDIKPREKRDPNYRLLPHLHRAGTTIREHLKQIDDPDEYKKWEKWADKQFAKMDDCLDKMTDDEWERAERFSKAIERHIEENK